MNAMRKWIESALALVRDRLRGFPSIRRAIAITVNERDTCERYGEHVIGTMLAGGLTPKPSDLAALYQTDESREHARDWLTERADYREKWERWKSFKNDVLEIAVIALIGIEIALSVTFGGIGIYEGWKQGEVLDRQAKALEHMDQSAVATADAMKAARDSLKLLADDQAKSLGILQEEQADRARKPNFVLYLGNIPIDKAPPIHLAARGEEAPTLRFDLTLKNEGDAQANDSELHVLVPDSVYVNCSALPQLREYEPPKPGMRGLTFEAPVMPAGKTLRINTEITAPRGSPPFKATFTIVTAQLKAVARMGSLTVIPPK
jgi:hypothetical protein